MIAPLCMSAARLNGRYIMFEPVMQATGNLHGLWVNLLHKCLALTVVFSLSAHTIMSEIAGVKE